MRVVLFDGVCNLCNASVRFVIARDPERRFTFAPLQSATAARLLAERGVMVRLKPDTTYGHYVTIDRDLTRERT